MTIKNEIQYKSNSKLTLVNTTLDLIQDTPNSEQFDSPALKLTKSEYNSDNDYMKQPTKEQCLYTLIDLVKYPVITEKTYISSVRNGQYTFDIDKRLTKTQIKKLFSSLFKVSVVAVNTHMLPRKKIRVGMAQGFRPTFKRVIITLKKGDSINYNLTNIDFNNNK